MNSKMHLPNKRVAITVAICLAIIAISFVLPATPIFFQFPTLYSVTFLVFFLIGFFALQFAAGVRLLGALLYGLGLIGLCGAALWTLGIWLTQGLVGNSGLGGLLVAIPVTIIGSVGLAFVCTHAVRGIARSYFDTEIRAVLALLIAAAAVGVDVLVLASLTRFA